MPPAAEKEKKNGGNYENGTKASSNKLQCWWNRVAPINHISIRNRRHRLEKPEIISNVENRERQYYPQSDFNKLFQLLRLRKDIQRNR